MDKEKIEPYLVTNKNKLSEIAEIIEVENKYRYLIKLNNDILIEYEGKVGEVDRKDPIVEISFSAENIQSNFPVTLLAKVTSDGEK